MHPRGIGTVVLRNTLWNYLATFVSLAVGLTLVPLLIRYLGDAAYGLWVLATAVLGYSGLLDFGLHASVSKWVAEHRDREAHAERNALLSTVFTLFLTVGALVLLGVVALAFTFDRIFVIDPGQRETARLLILVLGIGVAAEFPLGLFGAPIFAYERLDVANALTLTHLLLGLACITVALAAGYGLVTVGVIHTAVTLVCHAIRFAAARRIVPGFRISFALFDRRRLREVGPFGALMFVDQVSKRAMQRTDEIVVGLFLPLPAVSTYSIGLRLNNAIRTLAEQLSKVVFPTGAYLYATRDMSRLRLLMLEGTRLTLAVGLPVALCVLVLADEIVATWLGRPVPEAATIARLLALATIAGMLQWVPSTLAQAAGRATVPSGLVALEALLHVGLGLALVGPLGIVGVAIGALLPALLLAPFAQVPYACRVLEVRLRDFAREALLPPLGATAPLLLILPLSLAYRGDDSAWSLAACVGLGLGLSWLAFITLCVPRHDARRYREQLRHLARRGLFGAAR